MPTNIPKNELERIFALSDLNLDFSNIEIDFKDLALLAAKISGMEVSLVNIVDTFTQWTIASHGMPLEQLPREDSVCQYTILGDTAFEVADLSSDERFRDKDYVSGEPHLRYYYGLPLQYNNYNLGALCVLDASQKNITPEKAEMLRLIAGEVVERLKVLKHLHDMSNAVSDAKMNQNKVLHDIRGPLGGIMQLAQLIKEQGEKNSMADVIELINLIYSGSKSLLELADQILDKELTQAPAAQKGSGFTVQQFREKLEKLYLPQAKGKQVNLKVEASDTGTELPFSSGKLMQITGNLISNAIKYTPAGGTVSVALSTAAATEGRLLEIAVSDTGCGLSEARIAELLSDNNTSTTGSEGETGYAFGLKLVKHLIETLKGKLLIESSEAGSVFRVQLPYQA